MQSNTKRWSPRAFQIPRPDGDEDEKGAVALEGNLGGTPRGVWVQETVHRLEPGRQRRGRSRGLKAEVIAVFVLYALRRLTLAAAQSERASGTEECATVDYSARINQTRASAFLVTPNSSLKCAAVARSMSPVGY